MVNEDTKAYDAAREALAKRVVEHYSRIATIKFMAQLDDILEAFPKELLACEVAGSKVYSKKYDNNAENI